MSEFEDKLQSILGNPDAMNQIMSIAQSITGNSHESETAPPEEISAEPAAETGGDPFPCWGTWTPGCCRWECVCCPSTMPKTTGKPRCSPPCSPLSNKSAMRR